MATRVGTSAPRRAEMEWGGLYVDIDSAHQLCRSSSKK